MSHPQVPILNCHHALLTSFLGTFPENLATNSLSSNQLLGNQYYNGLSYNGVNYNGNILAFLQSLQARGLINPVMRDGLYNDPCIGPILQNWIRQGQLGGNFWMNGAGHCSGVACKALRRRYD